MINIKYACLGLSRKITFTIIAVLQLTISFTFLYNVIYINGQVSSAKNKITLTLDKANINLIEPVSNLDDIRSDKNNNPLKFYEYLKSNKSIEHCTVYEDHLLLRGFNNNERFLMTNNYAPEKEGTQYFPMKTLKIDYKYNENFPYKVIEGKGFTVEDFNDNGTDIPILLGSNYRNVFNINDSIEFFDYFKGKRKLKVKGFIDEGYNYIGRPISHMNIHMLDNYIIFPMPSNIKFDMNNETDKFEIENRIMESFLIINDKNPEAVIEEIVQFSSNHFGNIKITSIDEKVDKYRKMYKTEENIVTSIFLIVFIMYSIGIITNMINSLENRYKEFGVHLLNGASIQDIRIRVLYEILIIVLSSLCLSFTGIRILIMLKFVSWSYIYFGQLVLAISIITLIIAAYPMHIIKGISINSLIRRE